MKHSVTILFIFCSVLFAQRNRQDFLQQVQSRSDLEISKSQKVGNENLLNIEYPGGKTIYKNLSNKKGETINISTTTINVWEVDTTLYQNMYPYWQEVPISTLSNRQIVISDLNKNGKPDFYGYTKNYDDLFEGSPVTIFELDSNNYFVYRYTYADSVIHTYTVYDIKQDGNVNLFLNSLEGNGLFYKSDNIGELPTNIDLVFYRYQNRRQMNDPTFGDFDKNGKTDLLYYEFYEMKSYLFEYNATSNNLDSISVFMPFTGYCAGYAVGDFDMDDKTDIVYGSIDGEVFLVEADGEHTYNNILIDTVDTYNAYMQMATNDIDENSKPEFWVGGAAFYDPNPPITRFTCFEMVGDNQYQEVHRIDIVGIFSFYAGNCFSLDVDKDGIEELVICIEQHVFIFKFNGKPDKPSFELFYVKRNSNPNGVFYGVTMNDLDGDGYEEMLIHQDNIRADGKGRHFTSISKPNFISGINNEKNLELNDYVLEDCYPNPFNSSTFISFKLAQTCEVALNIFDVLGNQVSTLFKGSANFGDHRVEWNGKDNFNNPVNSGVYFVQLITNNFQKTIKAVLIK